MHTPNQLILSLSYSTMAVNHENKDAYIDGREDKVVALENEVRNLQSKIVLLQGKKHSKKELKDLYEWNDQDVHLSDTVMTYCKGFLFPRYKFLGKNWKEIDDKPKSFSELVRRSLSLPRGMEFGDVWHRVITPTIAKKYANLRCNINNVCRSSFLGE